MGTRGLMGFVVDGEVKATYNHFDSYPGGLGADVGAFARSITDENRDAVKDAVRNLRLVKEDETPTAEDLKTFSYFHQNVSTGGDWYALLRGTQGNPAAVLDAGVMIDSYDFGYDSLFCEWGYLLNFDTGSIEVYRGFQEDADAVEGRFFQETVEGSYAGISLIDTVPFADADDDYWKAVASKVYGEDA